MALGFMGDAGGQFRVFQGDIHVVSGIEGGCIGQDLAIFPEDGEAAFQCFRRRGEADQRGQVSDLSLLLIERMSDLSGQCCDLLPECILPPCQSFRGQREAGGSQAQGSPMPCDPGSDGMKQSVHDPIIVLSFRMQAIPHAGGEPLIQLAL